MNNTIERSLVDFKYTHQKLYNRQICSKKSLKFGTGKAAIGPYGTVITMHRLPFPLQHMWS